MFNSGFAESTSDADLLQEASVPDDASVSDVGAYAQHFDDSDAEDEDIWENFEDILFGDLRRRDRVSRFHRVIVD